MPHSISSEKTEILSGIPIYRIKAKRQSAKKKINNRFILSFLHYIPFAVLTTMTIPGIFYSVSNKFSAFFGFAAALISAYFGKSLLKVAIYACVAVLIAELII